MHGLTNGTHSYTPLRLRQGKLNTVICINFLTLTENVERVITIIDRADILCGCSISGLFIKKV